MISKKSYIADGNTNRFLSDFIIRSSQFARPYIYIYDNTLPSDGTGDILVNGSIDQADWSYPDNIWKRGTNAPASFDLVTVDKWQVVDNSILFYTNPVMGSTIWVEVATTADEFGETLVQPSVEKAEEAALQAQNSAASASASATTSSAGASSASASAANAATSEANALVSENNAKTSELNALVSENNAATSETNASVSETNTSVSESNAALSENNAATSETNASISEANALVSENNAKTSELNAATSEASAADSAASVEPTTIVHTQGSGLDNELLTYLKTIDGAGSGLDADLVQGVDKNLLGIGGDGYAWVDEKANRALETTYTNTNGKPIMLIVSCSNKSSENNYAVVYVDGLLISRHRVYSDGGAGAYHQNSSVIIPNGSTYSVKDNDGAGVSTQLLSWLELK